MSNNKNNQVAGRCISLGTVLFIVFLILKLCNVITWSWWWVTAPLWIPFGLALIVMTIGLLLIGIASYLENKL